MDLKIKGKRALVMGASSGIGRAIAEALIQEGARVAICARGEEKLQATAKAIKSEIALPCDVSKPGAAKKLVEDVSKKLGGLDILVTNTGGPAKGDFLDVSSDAWEAGFRNLYMSVVEALQAAIPGMKAQRWGRVLLVTSAAAREPMPKLTISNGLRSGLSGLVKSLSNEFAGFNITINALLPGYTDTDRLRELAIPMEKMTGQIPAGRLGKPEEMGAVAAFLSSAAAAYLTGQSIAVDGGYLRSL